MADNSFTVFASPDFLPLGALLLLLKAARLRLCVVTSYVHSYVSTRSREHRLVTGLTECISKHYSWEGNHTGLPHFSIVWKPFKRKGPDISLVSGHSSGGEYTEISGVGNVARFLCRYFTPLRGLYDEFKNPAQAAAVDMWLGVAERLRAQDSIAIDELLVMLEQHLYERETWFLVGHDITIADVIIFGVGEEAIRRARQRFRDEQKEHPRLARLGKALAVHMGSKDLEQAINEVTQISATTYEVDEEYDVVGAKGFIDTHDMPTWHLLLKRTRDRQVVPFVGAGISMPWLPGWQQLLMEVSQRIGRLDGLANPCGECGAVKHGLHVVTDIIKEQLPNGAQQLSEEITRVFQERLAAHGASDSIIDSLTCRENANANSHLKALSRSPTLPPAVSRALKVPAAIVGGPFPFFCTTNWDAALETAYELLYWAEKDWPQEHPKANYFYRMARTLPVRYRADVQQIFAELRAGIQPGRLLKLHGDLTRTGKNEIVAGYEDYRRLMVRDHDFRQFLQHMFTYNSVLFYGCSLSDPDILANLDGLRETFGPEVGPHFWITADRVSDAHKSFLLRQYSVHVIRTKDVKAFDQQRGLMLSLCNLGWTLPPLLSFRTLSCYVYAPAPARKGRRTSVLVSTPKPGQEGGGSYEDQRKLKVSVDCIDVNLALKKGKNMAIAVSVGCSHDNRPQYGPLAHQVFSALGCHDDAVRFAKNFMFAEEDDLPWRAVQLPVNQELKQKNEIAGRVRVWLVCGQRLNRSGRAGVVDVRSIYKATHHFLDVALNDERRRVGEDGKVCLWLPLLNAGKGGMRYDFVLITMLSAIGKFASRPTFTDTGRVHVKLSLGTRPSNIGRTLPLRYDVMSGRIPFTAILSRAVHNTMEITCVAKSRKFGWICRRVQVDMKTTMQELLAMLGLDEDDALPDHIRVRMRTRLAQDLMHYDITDGCVLDLVPNAPPPVVKASHIYSLPVSQATSPTLTNPPASFPVSGGHFASFSHSNFKDTSPGPLPPPLILSPLARQRGKSVPSSLGGGLPGENHGSLMNRSRDELVTRPVIEISPVRRGSVEKRSPLAQNRGGTYRKLS